MAKDLGNIHYFHGHEPVLILALTLDVGEQISIALKNKGYCGYHYLDGKSLGKP